jgi:hypothetical protein
MVVSVVAVASAPSRLAVARRRLDRWLVASFAAFVLAVTLRFALGGGGVGARSAVVMLTLLVLGLGLAAWLGTRSARGVFWIVLATSAAVDLGALPVRNAPEYDEREALYRVDQAVGRSVEVPSNGSPLMLTVLAQAVWPADRPQPAFGVAAEVAGQQLAWRCEFERDIRRLALPVPGEIVANAQNVDARLRLTGVPSRETDYLVVYSSSGQGGYLIWLTPETSLSADITHCSLAT